jgi:hypothetical protein
MEGSDLVGPRVACEAFPTTLDFGGWAYGLTTATWVESHFFNAPQPISTNESRGLKALSPEQKSGSDQTLVAIFHLTVHKNILPQ